MYTAHTCCIYFEPALDRAIFTVHHATSSQQVTTMQCPIKREVDATEAKAQQFCHGIYNRGQSITS